MKQRKLWESYYKKMSGTEHGFLLSGAMSMLARNHFDKAIFLFKEVIELSPNLFDAFSGIVTALHQIGDVEESIKFAKRALQIEPSSIYIREIMSSCLYEEGKVSEAIDCVNSVLNIDPSSQTAISLLILFESGSLCFEHIAEEPKAGNQVVLVNSPYWLIGAPNCGLGYIGEALRENNISFTLLDLNRIFYENLPQKHKAMLRPETMVTWYDAGFFRILELKLKAFIETYAEWITKNSLIVGLSSAITSRNFSLSLAKTIKKISPNFPIVFGGYDCIRPLPCENYSNHVDAFIIGEGEVSFPLLVKTYIEGMKTHKNINPARKIPGVMYANGTYEQQKPCNVNKIAFPRYTELNLGKYVNENGVRTIAINSSRGCVWGHCTFCSISRTSFRQRTPKSIYEEIKYHHLQNGVRNFIFSDVQAGGTAKNIIELAELIANEPKLVVTLEGQIRFSRELLEPEAFKTLKKAGFNYIQFGLESGSERILQKMKKGINIKLAKDTLRACKVAGISPGIFIIVGFPGETEDDHIATLTFLEEMADVIEQIETVNTFIAAYGSPYWQELDNKGIVCDEFSGIIVGDWVEDENTPESRERKRREVMDKAAAVNINTGLFIKDGANMELVRFFWERGETKRAEQVLSKIGESGTMRQNSNNQYVANPENSIRLIQKYMSTGNVKKAICILEKQQNEKPCFHFDFHMVSEIVYKKTGVSYVSSPLFKLLSEKFYSQIRHTLDSKLSGRCLVVGTSFQYHTLLMLHAVKHLNNVSLLVKEKDIRFFSSFFPKVSIIGFEQKNLNKDIVTDNKTISSTLSENKQWNTVIILQNQSPPGAYKDVIAFCQALNPKTIITVTWDAKAHKLDEYTMK